MVSAAAMDNHSSRGVSLAVGYESDGIEVVDVGGFPKVMERFRIAESRWRRRPSSTSVTTEGFEGFRRRIGLIG